MKNRNFELGKFGAILGKSWDTYVFRRVPTGKEPDLGRALPDVHVRAFNVRPECRTDSPPTPADEKTVEKDYGPKTPDHERVRTTTRGIVTNQFNTANSD